MIPPKKQKFFLKTFLACLGLSIAIASCTNQATPPETPQPTSPTEIPPTPDSVISPTTEQTRIPGEQNWVTLLPNEAIHNLDFTAAGSLTYQGQTLLEKIPVSYSSDGTVTYAKRLIISEPSPSGNFNFVKACETPSNEAGLCWSVFLVNRNQGTAKQTAIGKYGGLNWVQWSQDERYAVLVEKMEGVFQLIVVDLPTGEAKFFAETYPNADLTRFTWTSDRTFEVPVLNCQDGNCPESSFTGNIKTLFAE